MIYMNYWHWLILAVLLMGSELLLPGAFMLWLGLAAGVVGLVMWLILPVAPIEIQFIGFAILSVLFAYVGRTYMKRNPTPSDHPTLNNRGATYIGKRVVVSQTIVNGRGKVLVGDSTWLAEGDNAEAGESVEVVAVKGITLMVRRIS